MTRGDAEKVVRQRWERLGLEPETAPRVFESDIDNMLRWAEDKSRTDYRKRVGGSGRSVPQYSDPARSE